ncbi:MAG: carboxypeptidase-like regulatory domain-containing protein [Gemmataceae bacterium]
MSKRIVAAAAFVSCVTLLGCGGGGNPNASARVSGSLSYNGKPIKGAMVQFHSASGTAYEATVSSDGTYQAIDIAPGEMVVTVDTESLNPAKKGGASRDPKAELRMKMEASNSRRGDAPSSAASEPPPSALYVKIPAKYNNAKTSPLTITLKPGRQVHNIELTD